MLRLEKVISEGLMNAKKTLWPLDAVVFLEAFVWNTSFKSLSSSLIIYEKTEFYITSLWFPCGVRTEWLLQVLNHATQTVRASARYVFETFKFHSVTSRVKISLTTEEQQLEHDHSLMSPLIYFRREILNWFIMQALTFHRKLHLKFVNNSNSLSIIRATVPTANWRPPSL